MRKNQTCRQKAASCERRINLSNTYPGMCRFVAVALCCCFLSPLFTVAQDTPAISHVPPAERATDSAFFMKQLDVLDIAMKLLHKNPITRLDKYEARPTKLKLSGGPIAEYTITTGFTYGLALAGQFATSLKENTTPSSILTQLKLTQKHQLVIPFTTAILTAGDEFYFLGDWRYLNFPQDSYGFGSLTTKDDVFTIKDKYVRLYETFLKRIRPHLYAGFGYQLDNHWNISQENIPPGITTDFSKYGFSSSSVSSGFTLNFLYDSRTNPAAPVNGATYANVYWVNNLTGLGSTSRWSSMVLDLRKYFRVSATSQLALWSYDVFTLSGNPPYLDLPGTGNDTYNNTGRGYEQGRFIGKKMIDVEAEYRFGITHDGLIGGVVFAGGESLSELGSNQFESVLPSAGVGLRIKFNKFSNTNLCIDFGVGVRGSKGFVGNLGENF